MDIKELEAFVYVIKYAGFSRAAKELHLTQPTISTHIASLERKLGVKLIVRTTKQTRPSEAGRILYHYAEEILKLRENAVSALDDFSREMRGTVALAVSDGAGRDKVEILLEEFREKYPEIVFDVRFENDCHVQDLVAARKAELGFCKTYCTNRRCVWRTFVNGPNGGQYHVLKNKNNVLQPITQTFYDYILPFCAGGQP